MFSEKIFRKYDIRGVVHKEFYTDFAFALGQAVVKAIQDTRGPDWPVKICIGFDARHTSRPLAEAVAQGVIKSGADAYFLGLVTSPLNYYATFNLAGAPDGVMVTGSHNPPEYNGFKVSMDKKSLFGGQVQKLKQIILQKDFPQPRQEGRLIHKDIRPQYVQRYVKEFGDLSGVPVVVDCGNGAAGSVVRSLYDALKVEATYMFEKPDGDFPNHHPDPSVPENLQSLMQEVLKQGAAMGIAFDGDADRIGVVDEQGRALPNDHLMSIYARQVLQQNPGATVVGDVKCSDTLFDTIKQCGGKPLMWTTGCSIVRDKVRTTGAALGGELSGHVFFADRNYGFDDGLYAGLRLLEIVKSSGGKGVSGLLKNLPQRFSTKEIRVPLPDRLRPHIIGRVKEHVLKQARHTDINEIDGLRVTYERGWALVRLSHTEPHITMRFEFSTQAELHKIQNEYQKLLGGFLGFLEVG